MTLLSRPVRGTVRRTPDDHSDNDGPPMKRPRLQQELGHRRRQSSPDCLDTTTPDHKSPHGKLHLNSSSLKVARPRTATRRARRLSNSSADSIASSSHFHTAGNPRVNGNSLAKTPRVIADRDGPSGGASILLADARESPDPLDTISPSPTKGSIKSASRIYGPIKNTEKEPVNSPTTTRTTRQNDVDLKVEEGQDTATGSKDASRPSRNTAHEGSEVKQQNASEVEQTQEQDASAQTRTERRSLRSTDTGSRSKSELAQYFYNYEQIISLDEPKPGKFEFAPKPPVNSEVNQIRSGVAYGQYNNCLDRRSPKTNNLTFNPGSNTIRKSITKSSQLQGDRSSKLRVKSTSRRPSERRTILPRPSQVRTSRKTATKHRARSCPARKTTTRSTPRRSPRSRLATGNGLNRRARKREKSLRTKTPNPNPRTRRPSQ